MGEVSQEWWRSFYQGPFGALQVGGLHPDSTERDIERVMRRVGKDDAKILDAPCGAGRHSLALAKNGYQVVGIDFNPSVLEVARTAAAKESLAIEFHEKDLRSLESAADFDAVICLWSSLGYFSETENDAVLRNLANAVRPGGVLFIDTQVSESLFGHHRTRDWMWWGEGEARTRVCEERHWNPLTSRVEGEWTFMNSEQIEIRRSSIRIYSCYELVSRLRSAGFTEFEATGQDGSKFTIGSSRLWLEAKKSA